MEDNNVSVLICDDSALMRNLVGRMIESADDLTLAGKAMNGKFLLEKIPRLNPDVIILDLEMPEMNGIEFLKERRRLGIDIPVVILSSIARRGAQITMEALSLGASDFILKPSGSVSEDIYVVQDQIIQTVRAYGLQYKKARGKASGPDRPAALGPEPKRPDAVRPVTAHPESFRTVPAPPDPVPALTREIDIVVIGISTGGPNALRDVLPRLEADFPVPVVIVQHMPAGFTTEFAKSLDRICPLSVKEAENGDVLSPGRIFIAPGNYHVLVEKRRLAAVLKTTSDDPENGHRPSVGVLFNSIAKNYGGRSMAVIMTGMGKDGAHEIGGIYKLGGLTIGQDEKTSVVYGMPKVAGDNGYLRQVLPLEKIGEAINRLARGNRLPEPAS